LAVEEQFYLLWPAVLPFFARSGRRIVAAIVAVAAWRVGALLLGWDLEVQLGTASNALGLMAGAWVALCGARAPAWAFPAGIAGLVAVSALPAAMPRELMLLLVAPLATGMAVVAVLGRDAGAPRPLRWIARVSYGWYLWHVPLIGLWGGSMATDLLLSALALAIAAVSYEVVERPIMDAAAARTRPRFGPVEGAAGQVDVARYSSSHS
jgi:peptidoglycan/LPS O-acetylase OafA/YrhL